MTKELSSFSFDELASFFLGNRHQTCSVFEINPDCDKEWYYVLGELCFFMSKDTEFDKFVDETIERLDPLRKACIISELECCEKSLNLALISVNDENENLRAASLRKISECYSRKHIEQLHAATRDDSKFVRGAAIEHLVYFLAEKTEALEKLRSSISSESDFVQSFYEDAIEDVEVYHSFFLNKV